MFKRYVLPAAIAAGWLGCATTRVGPALVVSDGWIGTRAENEMRTFVTADERVQVTAKNGEIFLSGRMTAPARARALAAKLENIRGVRKVHNRIGG